MEVKGQLNVSKFYDVLAAILSRKYGAKITVIEIKENHEKAEMKKASA